jgi:hypothetical protein
MRRADGSRAAAEYFGWGVVGDIWRDVAVPESAPRRKWAWYAAIVDYVPFARPVPAKVDGAFFENIPVNLWRNGVRLVDDETYSAILQAAGRPFEDGGAERPALALPSLDDVLLPTRQNSDLLAPAAADGAPPGARQGRGSARRSRDAAVVGRRAEEIVTRWAAGEYPNTTIRWVAQEGATPGWDIEVCDGETALIALEVKGTSRAAFLNFELTEGELRASERLRERYHLVLVANCLGTAPSVQVVTNPYDLWTRGVLQRDPTGYRVRRARAARTRRGPRAGLPLPASRARAPRVSCPDVPGAVVSSRAA